MTKEQRERSAYNMSFEESQEYISKCVFNIPWNDGDVFVDERELTRTLGNVLKWRIDSVWHKAEEKIVVLHEDVVAETKFGWKIGIFNAIGSFHEYVGLTTRNGEEYALYDIKRFAYIKDLMPSE